MARGAAGAFALTVYHLSHCVWRHRSPFPSIPLLASLHLELQNKKPPHAKESFHHRTDNEPVNVGHLLHFPEQGKDSFQEMRTSQQLGWKSQQIPNTISPVIRDVPMLAYNLSFEHTINKAEGENSERHFFPPVFPSRSNTSTPQP